MSATCLTPALAAYEHRAASSLGALVGAPVDGIVVGTDVQEVAAIADSIATLGERYLRHVYTDEELRAAGYPDRPDTELAASLAARFAVKESVVKALGAAEPRLPWTSIEVLPGRDRTWRIGLSGRIEEIAETAGLEQWSVSFAHDDAYAVATVVGTGSWNDPGSPQRTSLSRTGNRHG